MPLCMRLEPPVCLSASVSYLYHVCAYTHLRAHFHARMCAYTHTSTRIYTHAYTYAYGRTRTHYTLVHSYTCIHSLFIYIIYSEHAHCAHVHTLTRRQCPQI